MVFGKIKPGCVYTEFCVLVSDGWKVGPSEMIPHQTPCSDQAWDHLNCFQKCCEEGKGRRGGGAYHEVYELFSQGLCHITQERGRM